MKKWIKIALVSVVLILTVIAAVKYFEIPVEKRDPTKKIFKVTVEIVWGEGTTNPAPGTYEKNEGDTFIISLQPANGWKGHYHLHSEGDTDSPDDLKWDSNLSFKVTGNMLVQAFFAKIPEDKAATLTIKVVGKGETLPAAGTYTKEKGDKITIGQIAALNWQFDHWQIDTWSGTTTETTIYTQFTISEDTIVTAFFKEVAVTETHGLEIQGTYRVLSGNGSRLEVKLHSNSTYAFIINMTFNGYYLNNTWSWSEVAAFQPNPTPDHYVNSYDLDEYAKLTDIAMEITYENEQHKGKVWLNIDLNQPPVNYLKYLSDEYFNLLH